MKKIIFILAAALVCTSLSAKEKKTKKGKKAAEPVEVVDTININDFSFHMGRANTQGLKQYLVQRMDIDTAYIADFLAGFDEQTLTEADKKMKARLAGKEIRQQVEGQIIPQVNKQIDEKQDKLNQELFVKGFRAGIAGDEVPGISMDSTQALVKKNMDYYHKAQMEAKYGENRRAGEEYLKANAKKDSVQTTASGLQYKVLVKGTGETPKTSDKVKVHYRGTLIDGTEFDSSYKRNQPATFGVTQVIKGWTEALTMMPVGSKWMVYIPQELGYGDRESGKIPPFSALVFEVELLEIVK